MLDVPHGIKFIGKYDGVTSGIFGFSMHTNLPLHRTFVENLMVYNTMNNKKEIIKKNKRRNTLCRYKTIQS